MSSKPGIVPCLRSAASSPPNCCYDGRMRQSRIAQRLREFVDRRDAAQSGTFHATTLIFGLLDRTI